MKPWDAGCRRGSPAHRGAGGAAGRAAGAGSGVTSWRGSLVARARPGRRRGGLGALDGAGSRISAACCSRGSAPWSPLTWVSWSGSSGAAGSYVIGSMVVSVYCAGGGCCGCCPPPPPCWDGSGRRSGARRAQLRTPVSADLLRDLLEELHGPRWGRSGHLRFMAIDDALVGLLLLLLGEVRPQIVGHLLRPHARHRRDLDHLGKDDLRRRAILEEGGERPLVAPPLRRGGLLRGSGDGHVDDHVVVQEVGVLEDQPGCHRHLLASARRPAGT